MSVHQEWPPRSRWRLADQDVIADLESIRRDLQFLRASKANVPEGHIQEWQAAIDGCAKEVKTHFFLTNRIFIRQTLAQIQQELIIVTSRNNLDGTWMALKKKLMSIDEEGKQDPSILKLVKEIDEFFAAKDQTEASELVARRRMRAIRKFIDDGLILDLAAAYSLKRSAEALVVYLCVLVSVIAVFLGETHSCAADAIVACWFPNAIGLALFGALGGTISAIVRPTPGKNSDGLNLLTRFSLMRVLLGGVSGLFLFLLFSSGVVSLRLPYSGVCALAMAFGFSERALISALSSTANRIDLEITRATGQHGMGDKTASTNRRRPEKQKP